MRQWVRDAHGQAAVEVVGLLPLLLAVGFGVVSLIGAGAAQQAAAGAAEAGAVALLQGRDGRAAATAALTGWPSSRTRITLSGRRVTVRVTPRGPLGRRLRATVSADAGSGSAAARRADAGRALRSRDPGRLHPQRRAGALPSAGARP